VLLAEAQGLLGGGERHLVLAHQHGARLDRTNGISDVLFGQQIVRARNHDDAIGTVLVDRDGSEAARYQWRREYVREIDRVGGVVVARLRAVRVLAELGDHHDVGAQASGLDGLVGSLATEALREVRAEHGLARQRQSIRVRDQIDIR